MVTSRPSCDPAAAPHGAPASTAEPVHESFTHALAAHLVATHEGSLAVLLQQVLGEPLRAEPLQRRDQAAGELGLQLCERLHLQVVRDRL
ncbi:hypothetical protein ABZ897_53875 [Nonomuraea sp. NPDC046802]|uniref:hypothetical protein n=1 Tax=Nonomuraea sp. NPDC046802 TaxID=3154919 RepID=UPI0033D5031A